MRLSPVSYYYPKAPSSGICDKQDKGNRPSPAVKHRKRKVKGVKIYKTKTWEETIQFSFVSSDDSYYHYLYLSSDTGNWLFSDTKGFNIIWSASGPCKYSTESSWLEVMVLTGYTKDKVEERIKASQSHYRMG